MILNPADVMAQAVLGIVGSLIQLVISIFLAMASVYVGIRMFDKSTEGIDEMAEIKKGNVAVALLLAVVIFSIANVIEAGVSGLTAALLSNASIPVILVGFGIGIVQLLVGLAVAVFSINVAIRVLDKITTEMDEMKELKRGNVAVAILMSGVLIAVSTVIKAGVVGLSHAVDPIALAGALGLL